MDNRYILDGQMTMWEWLEIKEKQEKEEKENEQESVIFFAK